MLWDPDQEVALCTYELLVVQPNDSLPELGVECSRVKNLKVLELGAGNEDAEIVERVGLFDYEGFYIASDHGGRFFVWNNHTEAGDVLMLSQQCVDDVCERVLAFGDVNVGRLPKGHPRGKRI